MKSHGLPTLSRVTGRQSLPKNHRLCKNLKAVKQMSWESLALSCIHPQRWWADKGGQLEEGGRVRVLDASVQVARSFLPEASSLVTSRRVCGQPGHLAGR